MERGYGIKFNFIKKMPFLFKGIFYSAIITSLFGYLTMMDSEYYDFYDASFILFINFVAMILPLSFFFRNFSRNKDIFNPSNIACAGFFVFQLFLNLFAITNPEMLEYKSRMPGALLVVTIIHSYIVVIVAWCSFELGHKILEVIVSDKRTITTNLPQKPHLFVLIGLAFLGIGVIGNIELIGGLENYIKKMRQFYEIWKIYVDLSQVGATKWKTASYFLPIGLVIIGHGFSLKYKVSKKRYQLIILLLSLANLLLSNATGSRGIGTLTLLYFIILYNLFYQRLRPLKLAGFSVIYIIIVIILGDWRSTAYYGTEREYSAVNILSLYLGFVGNYLSQFLETIVLVNIVETKGILYGKTAFAGLTGILGGPSPLMTEQIYWDSLGMKFSSNPTFGPVGDLFVNFGWPGLIIGMFLIGMVIKWFSSIYQRGSSEPTLFSALVVIYTAYSSYFLIRANLSYMPTYFLLYSAPFYMAMFIFAHFSPAKRKLWITGC